MTISLLGMVFARFSHFLFFVCLLWTEASGEVSSDERDNPSSWLGGWNVADESSDTAFLVFPVEAHLDIPIHTTGDFGTMTTNILMIGATPMIPNFFDNWTDKMLEEMSKWRCKFHLSKQEDFGAQSATTQAQIRASEFDWTWYPPLFSWPFFVDCPLPRFEDTYEQIPIAVTLHIERKDEKKQREIARNFTFKTLPIFGRHRAIELQASLHAQQPQKEHRHSILMCLSPEMGYDYLTGDYDDSMSFFSFIDYHFSVHGVTHFIVYHPLEKDSSEWLESTVKFLRDSSVGINIELLPNQKSRGGEGNSSSSSSRLSFIPPTLFPSICLKHAKHKFDFVTLVWCLQLLQGPP